jgi:hypothetical protein
MNDEMMMLVRARIWSVSKSIKALVRKAITATDEGHRDYEREAKDSL